MSFLGGHAGWFVGGSGLQSDVTPGQRRDPRRGGKKTEESKTPETESQKPVCLASRRGWTGKAAGGFKCPADRACREAIGQ